MTRKINKEILHPNPYLSGAKGLFIHSIVYLTKLSVNDALNLLVRIKSNELISFCQQLLAFLLFECTTSENVLLTNDVNSFEHLGPEVLTGNRLSYHILYFNFIYLPSEFL